MICLVKLPHVPEVLNRKTDHTGRLPSQVCGQPLHDRFAPAFSVLAFHDHSHYVSVQTDLFLVVRLEGFVLGGKNTLL